MAFLKTNPVTVDTPTKKSQYDSVFENTQLASRLLACGITTSAAIANTTTETAFDKKYIMAANTIDRVGSILVVRAAGLFSNTGTPSLRLRIRLGGITGAEIFDGAVQTTVTGATNYPWMIEGHLLVRSLGSGSQCRLGAFHHMRLAGGSASSMYGPWDTTNLITADFTISNDIVITATWGTASASNTIVMNAFSVDVKIPESTVS